MVSDKKIAPHPDPAMASPALTETSTLEADLEGPPNNTKCEEETVMVSGERCKIPTAVVDRGS